MLIPTDVAEREPLSELDTDLAETEAQLARNPSAKMLLHFLAVEYFKRGYTRRSQVVCRKLTKLEPTRAAVWQMLARCQLKLRLDDDALSTLDVIFKLPGADADIVDWARQRVKELSPQLPSRPDDDDEPGVVTPPAPPPRSSPLGSLLEQRDIVTTLGGQAEDQLKAIKQQLAADPDNQELLDWYAFSLYSSDRVAEAIPIYERIVKDFTPTDATYYYLGSAYLKMADAKMAFIYFDSLKRHFPTSPLNKKVDEKRGKLRTLVKKP